MKKTMIIIAFLCTVGIGIFFAFLQNKRQPISKTKEVTIATEATKKLQQNDIPQAFEYRNTKLGFSFSVSHLLFERGDTEGLGDYLATSDNNNPHFYETKECAWSESKIPTCVALEIQKVVLSGQKKEDVILEQKDKIAMLEINNTDFYFYKGYNESSPGGWQVDYFVISKTSDTYFNIFTFPNSSRFIEKEILPTFKTTQ